MELLGGYNAVKEIVIMLFAYNALCVFMFSVIYYNSGFDKHFELPEGFAPNYQNCLYYSLAVQATCMAGEVYPKTAFGRGVLSFQITSAYVTTLMLLAPWVHHVNRARAS